MKKVELYSGPYGSGKTTILANKMKRVEVDDLYCTFLTLDSLVGNIVKEYKITAFPFEYALYINETNYLFIDNAEVFVNRMGVSLLEKLIDNSDKVYLSSVNSDFYYNFTGRDRKTDLETAIIKYLETIPDININKILLKGNHYLPSNYAKMLEEKYGYKE